MSATTVSLDAAAGRPRWRLLGRVAGAQVLVQALGFAVALVWIHALPPGAFALMTLALSAVAVATVLADAGAANGVLALASARPGAAASSGVLAALMRAQRPLLAALVLVGLPAITAALWPHRGALGLGAASGAALVAGLALLTVTLAAVQVHNGARQAFVRAAGDVSWLQGRELALATLRLGAAAVVALALWGLGTGPGAGALPAAGALFALAVHVGAAWLLALMLERWLRGRGVQAARGNRAASSLLAGQMRQQGPNAAWSVVASQASLWLVALLGGAAQVAEVGALGRLAALFVLIGAVVSLLVQPAFARERDPAALRARFASLNLAFAALLLLLLGSALVWPQAALVLLGAPYRHLESELALMVLGATLAAWNGALYALGCARGWVLPLAWAVAANVAATALALLAFDVATTAGALALAALNAGVSLVVIAIFVRRHLRAGTPALGAA